MLNPSIKLKLPEIGDGEQAPWVHRLLQIMAEHQEQIQRLEDEVRRLKGGPLRPQLKPNRLESAGQSGAKDPEVAEDDNLRRREPHGAKMALRTIH